MQVLLIEDSPTAAKSIELKLASQGFGVYVTDSGEEGVDLAKVYDYDLILLDLDLPDINGLEVLRLLRAAKLRTPIMMLSATNDVETKVKTFSAGADDYMVKPFHKDELTARVRAVIRRSKGHDHSVIWTGNIAVDIDSKTVKVNSLPVHLTPREYQVLELLSLRKNMPLTKEMCLTHLYNGMDEPEIKIIDVFICKLRKKLMSIPGCSGHIETIWGGGYMLRDPADAKIAA
jgi:two-component system cell cycle response regulator CtrA